MSVTGIVLCGGRSRRMGQDKSAMPFGDETMVERVTRIVGQLAGEVLIVGRRDQTTPTLHDRIEHQGPLAGIAAGLAASANDLNLVVACDMPLLRPAVLQRLLDGIDDGDISLALVGGHPSVLCGAYRSRVAPIAQALLDRGERRVMALLDHVKTHQIDAALLRDVDPELDTFFSVDTPEKYEAALLKRT